MTGAGSFYSVDGVIFEKAQLACEEQKLPKFIEINATLCAMLAITVATMTFNTFQKTLLKVTPVLVMTFTPMNS